MKKKNIFILSTVLSFSCLATKQEFDHAIDRFSEDMIDITTLKSIQSETTLRSILECRSENPKAASYDYLFPLSWWDFESLCTGSMKLVNYRYQSLDEKPKYPNEKYIEIVIQLFKERGLINIIVKSALDAGFHNPECLKHLVGHVREDLNIRLQQILELQNIINSKNIERFKLFISRFEKIEDLDKILQKNILNYFYEIDLFQFADHIVNKYYKSTNPTILLDHFKKSAARGISCLNTTIKTILKLDLGLTKLNDLNQKGAIEAGLLGNIDLLINVSGHVLKDDTKETYCKYLQIAAINHCSNAFLSLIPEIKHTTKEFTEAAMALSILDLNDLILSLNNKKHAEVLHNLFIKISQNSLTDSADFRTVFNYVLKNLNYKDFIEFKALPIAFQSGYLVPMHHGKQSSIEVLLKFKFSFLEQELEDILISKLDRTQIDVENSDYIALLNYALEKQKYKLLLKLVADKKDIKNCIISKILHYKNIEALKIIVEQYPQLFKKHIVKFIAIFAKEDFTEGVQLIFDILKLNYINLEKMVFEIFNIISAEGSDDIIKFKEVDNQNLYYSYLFLFRRLKTNLAEQFDFLKYVNLIISKKYYNFLHEFIEIMDDNALANLIEYAIRNNNSNIIETALFHNEQTIKYIETVMPELLIKFDGSLDPEFKKTIALIVTNHALNHIKNTPAELTVIQDGILPLLVIHQFYEHLRPLINKFENLDVTPWVAKAIQEHNYELLKSIITAKKIDFSKISQDLLRSLNHENPNDAKILKLLKTFRKI